ncbi:MULTISPECIES: hypothetical protein [Nostocales]|uniref:Uncharacterized protein n=3 Tax=Nostocales TaxID=1161 RepID=A0A0C1RIN5_9CYAN|nr:hypothetical protein [Tolypothrix bouteillei]KAF3884697.1 hypothetical protein DA73_0400003825 [Tolypothrix bouteillei VB521301]
MFKGILFAFAAVIIPLASYSHNSAIANTPIQYHLSQNTKQTKTIRYERIGVGGIRLSMSEAQVRQILGKPVKVTNGFLGIVGKTRTLQYSGITVDLAEGSQPGNFDVYQIKANGSKYGTPDGVKIGDSQEKLMKIYGKSQPTQNGNVTHFNYSIDKPSPTSFVFTIKNGKVTEISCFDVLA